MKASVFVRWGRWVVSTFPLFGLLLRRLAISRLLVHAGDENAVRPLIAALGGRDQVVAGKARQALSALPSAASRDELIGCATAEPDLAAMVVASGYEHHDAKQHVTFLLAAWQSEDANARAAATGALGALTKPEQREALIQQVAATARFMPLVPLVVKSGYEHRDAKQHVAFLLTAWQSEDANARAAATGALGAFTKPEQREALIQQVAATARFMPLVPLVVKSGYEHRDAKQHVAFLLTAWQSEDANARAAATGALGALTKPEQREALIQQVAATARFMPLVPLVVKSGYEHRDAKQHVAFLLTAWQSEDANARAAATGALGAFTKPEQREALIQQIAATVRLMPLVSLVVKSGYEHRDAKQHVAFLLTAWQSEDANARAAATGALGAFTKPEQREALIQQVAATARFMPLVPLVVKSGYEHRDAKQHVAFLLTAWQSEDANARAAATGALGALTKPEQREALIQQVAATARFMPLVPLVVKSGYEHRDAKQHVAFLLTAWQSEDANARAAATGALGAFTKPEQREALIQQIAATVRLMPLVSLVVKSGYEHRDAKLHTAFLIAALLSSDASAKAAATQALGSLKSPAVRDGVIDAALAHESPAPLLEALRAAAVRHSEEGRHLLLLALSGRFNECLAADFELARLRVEYQAAPAELQRRIREAITRTGDTRMNGLFVREKRSTVLGELSSEEAELLVQVNARNGNWEALCKFLPLLPARAIASATRAMKNAGYESSDPDQRALLARLSTLVDEIGDEGGETRALPRLLPRAIQMWCARGEGTELDGKSDAELRGWFREETPPPDQIAAMAALAKRGKLGVEDIAACAASPHWMVRLTIAVYGGSPPVLEPGGSLVIQDMAPLFDAEAVWGNKPCDVTRDGLQALQEGLAGLRDRRVAGGLNLVAAVAAHFMAHDIEIDVGARVLVSDDAIEIEG